MYVTADLYVNYPNFRYWQDTIAGLWYNSRVMRAISPNHLKSGKGQAWQPGKFLLDDLAEGDSLDFSEIFPERPNQPVEIEIGVGKGTFLMDRAKRRPDVNFLGIEYAKSYAVYVADRARRAEFENVRMLCADASGVFRKALADASVMRVHIYFPDPWPKRRHNFRRLVQPAFIDQVQRVVRPGGQLLLVTDHRDYFEQMQRTMNNRPGWAVTEYPNLHEDSPYVVGTNFERKYVREGRPIFKMAFLKYV